MSTTVIRNEQLLPRLVNKKRSAYDVNIQRPSKWGNPFSHDPYSAAPFKVKTREEAVSAYRLWFPTQRSLISALHELDGKVLGCGCLPKSCHGQVICEMWWNYRRKRGEG